MLLIVTLLLKCEVFLDISKAFDKVLHDGLIYKLKRNGINGDLLGLIESFLPDRYQRVLLNGQTSNWNKIKGGVLQGSILRVYMKTFKGLHEGFLCKT